MSEQQQPPTAAQDQQPLFGIEKLYLKDMSLEVPNAPQVFFETEAPQVEVNVHNEATGMPQEGLFEVVLTVTVTAKIESRTIFLVEAAQAGIFQIRNIPQADLEAVLGTLCPNTLLPYAREAVASTIQRAGFPPITLQHMNFDLVYQQRMQELQQQAAAGAASPAPTTAH
jgi:preprotein translocase subunit SecB